MNIDICSDPDTPVSKKKRSNSNNSTKGFFLNLENWEQHLPRKITQKIKHVKNLIQMM